MEDIKNAIIHLLYIGPLFNLCFILHGWADQSDQSDNDRDTLVILISLWYKLLLSRDFACAWKFRGWKPVEQSKPPRVGPSKYPGGSTEITEFGTPDIRVDYSSHIIFSFPEDSEHLPLRYR